MDVSVALLKYCEVFVEQPVKSTVNKTYAETVLKFDEIFKLTICVFLNPRSIVGQPFDIFNCKIRN